MFCLDRISQVSEYELMEIEDVLPKTPEFTLKSSGKTYELRLVNLEDQVWIKNKFGTHEAFNEVLQQNDWSKSILLIYRLLKDKTDFMASEEPMIDDDGVSYKALVTGPYKLLKAISGVEEGAQVMGALAKSIMLSNPMIDKLVKESLKEELKKNSTGVKSSISSPRSMVGRPKK